MCVVTPVLVKRAAHRLETWHVPPVQLFDLVRFHLTLHQRRHNQPVGVCEPVNRLDLCPDVVGWGPLAKDFACDGSQSLRLAHCSVVLGCYW